MSQLHFDVIQGLLPHLCSEEICCVIVIIVYQNNSQHPVYRRCLCPLNSTFDNMQCADKSISKFIKHLQIQKGVETIKLTHTLFCNLMATWQKSIICCLFRCGLLSCVGLRWCHGECFLVCVCVRVLQQTPPVQSNDLLPCDHTYLFL